MSAIFRQTRNLAFMTGLLMGAPAAWAQGTHVGEAVTEAASEEVCAAKTQALYADLGARLRKLTEFIEDNRDGGWKMLRNHANYFLKDLTTPAFRHAGQVTRIIDFRARWRRRYTNVTASTPFALSRWELNAADAKLLCSAQGLPVSYRLPPWGGGSDPAKFTKVEGQITVQDDLQAMRFELERIRKEYVWGRSTDRGHRRVDKEIGEILALLPAAN